MMPRDEAWERRAAADHAENLLGLLRKGQDVDADAGRGDTLRAWLTALSAEIDKAIGKV